MSFRNLRQDMDLRQLAGALCWLLGIQYYISEFITGRWYRPTYHYRTDYMSVLGIVSCTPQQCSPLHALMNSSFIAEGLLFFFGILLLRPRLPSNAAVRLSELYLAISNISLIGLGVFTQERIRIHRLFAISHIVLGALGMLMLSAGYMNRKNRKVMAILLHINGLAVLGSIALLMASGYFTTIPEGLVERVSAYSVTDWMIIMGFVIFFRTVREIKTRNASPGFEIRSEQPAP